MANVRIKSLDKVVRVPDEIVSRGPDSTRAWLVNNGQATWQDLLGDQAASAGANGKFDAAMISAGKTINDIGSNVRQLYNELVGNKSEAEKAKADQAERDRQFSPLQSEYPVSTFAGSALPSFAVPGGKAAQLGFGAVEGFLQGDTIEDRLKLAAINTGLGFAGQKAGDWLGSRVGRFFAGLDPRSAGLADATGRLAREGIDATPAQRPSVIPGLKRDPVAQLTSTIRGIITGSKLPGTGSQVKKLNKLALDAIGEKGDEITLDVLSRAHTRIGDVFEGVANNVQSIDLTPHAPRLQSILQDVEIAETQGAALRRYFSEIDDAANSAAGITGERYNQLRNRLGKASRAAWRNGDELASETADSMIEILDDALEATSPYVAKSVAKAREQWRMLRVLRRARSVGDGDINPRSIQTSFESFYPGADVGKFPGNAAGKFGQSVADFNSTAIPRTTSGTAENILRVGSALGGTALAASGLGIPAAIGAGALGLLAYGGGGTGGLIGGGTGRGLLQALLQQQKQQQK